MHLIINNALLWDQKVLNWRDLEIIKGVGLALRPTSVQSFLREIEDQRFLRKIFLKTNARRKLKEDFTPLCLLAIHSTFVFYLHSSPLVNGWSHFTIHFSSRMQWRCWPIFIWRPTTGEMPPMPLTWYSKKTKTPTRQEDISKGPFTTDRLILC